MVRFHEGQRILPEKEISRTAEGEHQLTEQYQPDKAKVLVLDAHIEKGNGT